MTSQRATIPKKIISTAEYEEEEAEKCLFFSLFEHKNDQESIYTLIF